MRMLLKAKIPVAAGNAAIADGSLGGMIQTAMEQLNPEAAYFFAEDGMRTALFIFDLADLSQIPAVAEPFFQGAEASLELQPVMNIDDLQAGLSQLG